MKKSGFFKILKEYRDIIENEIPEIEAEKVLGRIEDKVFTTPLFERFKIALKVAGAGFIVLLIGILIFSLSKKIDDKPKINELRTELIIPDKNMKILWFQKKDFNLNNLKIKGGKNE